MPDELLPVNASAIDIEAVLKDLNVPFFCHQVQWQVKIQQETGNADGSCSMFVCSFAMTVLRRMNVYFLTRPQIDYCK